MSKKMPHITAAELNILKVLWQLGSGTVRDVKDRLEKDGESPAYTTVMTLMNQLATKHALQVDKSRQPFVYKPMVRRDRVLTQRLRDFLDSVFDGQAGELVLRLVEEGELTPEELRRVEQRIEAREREQAEREDQS